MMSRPLRLVRPKQSRKEPPGDRSRMLIVGERLMRAGSEGNLVRSRPQQEHSPALSNAQESALNMLAVPETVKSGQQLCCAEDVENLESKRSSGDENIRSDPWSPCTLPRKHALGVEWGGQDGLAMQPHSMEHRREAFLEHLKQKYPHHASTIMSHQDRLREHIRGNTQPSVGKQGDPRSPEPLDTMNEEAPSAFTRGSRTRASLPVVKSSNQTKDRSLGVLYLQYGEETRPIRMPNEVTSADTVRALFVSAFPQQLTLKMLESPNVVIYIKDHVRNVYYELTDIRNITAHSCLKVYHKDPTQAFNHSPLNSNGDARLSHYGGRQQGGGQSMHTLPPPHSPIQAGQGSISPPTGRSMPPSPSRFPYGLVLPAGATLPRERQSSVPITRSAPPCSSAILERRDVKPDEDVGSRVTPIYVDPYTDPYALAEARLSVASSQGTHASDMADGQVFLHRRSQSKSVGSYVDVPDSQHSLYRQRSRKYSENPHVPLGSKTPPSSPQRVADVRMIDIHPGQNAHILPQGAERTLHARRSFRKDSNGTIEAAPRVRGTLASPVFVDPPQGHGDRPLQGFITTEDPQSERMKAMEQQIASLTGLVQHALFKGTNTSGAKENASEKSSESPAHSTTSGGLSPVAGVKSPVAQAEPLDETLPQARDPSLGPLLGTFQSNVSSLRTQLQQLREMQLQNQEVVRLMLQQAEGALTERLSQQLRLLDDPVQKQRKLVEQERHSYVSMEENLLLQLGELENHVERLKKDSMKGTTQQPITLRDVEEGAVSLRTVGESLAALKGEFPALQLKMRSVLRVEVEAVRFLKEEPHKMDSMLKRVRVLTETLNDLRRCALEGHSLVDPVASTKLKTAEESDSPDMGQDATSPQPLSPARSELTSPSPVVVHQACSSPVTLQPCQHSVGLSHHPSPPLTPMLGRDSPAVAKVSPRSREDSTTLLEQEAPAVQERSTNCSSVPSHPPQHEETGKDKVVELEQMEQVEEAEAEMERKLRQAQASLMESIPDLEVGGQEESGSPNPANTSHPPHPLPEAITLAEPVADKPVQISGQKPPIEKPLRVKPSPEEASKSPAPPPPRRIYPPALGLTTARSGEVIYTARKEATLQQQDGEEGAPPGRLQRVPPEVKPKPHTSPPIHAAAARNGEEDDQDKIRAELQVSETSPGKDLEPRYIVDLTTHEFPDKELEAAFTLSSYDPKNTAHHYSDGQHSPKTPKPGSGVIYYITGTSKPPSNSTPSGPGEQNQSSEGITPSLKVAVLNPSDPSPWPNILTSHELTLDSPKLKEEDQKKTSNAEQMSVCVTEALKDSCRAEDVLAPKEGASEGMEDRLEEQVSSTAFEHLIAVTEEPPCVGGEDQTTTQVLPEPPVLLEENRREDSEQEVVSRSSREEHFHTEEERQREQPNSNPELPNEEALAPPDRFAFVITKTKVQALSTGEYQQLVSSKGQDVETVQVGADVADSASEDGVSGKKPVIIVFDEPMDIRQAYKRLSTIFECEEELERMLSEERIDEEPEDGEEEEAHWQQGEGVMSRPGEHLRTEKNPHTKGNGDQQSSTEDSTPQSKYGSKGELPNHTVQEGKKKFKFPFPKKQLAAIGQAIRTGTKAGKKTLQVVVYEDEEEADGTVKEAREAKRFEINSAVDSARATPSTAVTPQNHASGQQSPKLSTNEICENTYKTLDSLEETIKQLETTINKMEPVLSPGICRKDSKNKRTAVPGAEGEGSSPKKPAPLGPKPPKPQKPSQRKKAKAPSVPHPLPSSSSTSNQDTSGSPSSSRIASPKSFPQAGNVEKHGKPQKLQDSQRQFRQSRAGPYPVMLG